MSCWTNACHSAGLAISAATMRVDQRARYTDPAVLAATVRRCRRYPGIRLLAEKVETAADLDLARRLGFELFQGYALSRPQLLSVASVSPSRARRVQLRAALRTDHRAVD